MSNYTPSQIDRFWIRVKIDESDFSCWLWTKRKNQHGYGIATLNGKHEFAHRAAYMISMGEIPKNLCVCHRCDNPSCVNPNHLFLGTRADNMKDMYEKGRQKKTKEFATPSKTVKAIIHLWTTRKHIKKIEIARRFGVHPSTVSRIIKYYNK